MEHKETEKDNRMLFYNLLAPFLGEKTTNMICAELVAQGYFQLPASTHHHGNFMGGLFEHSYAVAKTLESLTRRLNLVWKDPRSPYVVGLFHDICKLDNYIINEAEKELSFEYKKGNFPGHGDKSLIMIQMIFSSRELLILNEEEIHCIRWHMGAFDEKSNWEYYSRAVTKWPNVLYTHTADMIVSKILDV